MVNKQISRKWTDDEMVQFMWDKYCEITNSPFYGTSLTKEDRGYVYLPNGNSIGEDPLDVLDMLASFLALDGLMTVQQGRERLKCW